MSRKPEGPTQPCLQGLKAWEKKHFSLNSRLRTVVSLLCAVVFAYRLLQLSRWSNNSTLGRQLMPLHNKAAAGQEAAWLPNPWVGQPQDLDPLSCTPQLLIIGAMKGGTTALFHYLNGSEPAIHYINGTKSPVTYTPRFHPSVIGSHVTKELHFFDKHTNHVMSPDFQRAYFSSFAGVDMTVDSPLEQKCSYPARLGLTSASKPAVVRMEATAMYLAHPYAAGHVRSLLPEARLVALLREPVSRALSSVNMRFQRSPMFEGLVEGSPEYNKAWQQYVMTELQNQLHELEACSSKLTPELPYYSQMDQCVFNASGTLKSVLHIHVGLYAVHLERWFNYFEPQQMLIWSSLAFEEKPRQHMEQLINWLGLNSSLIHPELSFHPLHERTYPSGSLPKSLFDQLQGFFRPHQQRLFELLELKGYKGLVQQLRTAWGIELQETIYALQQRP